MATPLTFTPVLDWVDASDPLNVPSNIRIITAADLLRYEAFSNAAKDRINSHDTTLTENAEAINGLSTTVNGAGGHHTRIGVLENIVEPMETTVTALTNDVTNLKKNRALATKTTSYTTTAADSIIIGNGAAVTITLLAAATATAGRVFTVKNRNASALTVASAGGTIDGGTTKTLAQWAAATFVSDGANWYTI